MKKNITKFEATDNFSCFDKYHQINVYLYMNDNSYVKTRTPLEAVKEFIEVIDEALILSKKSNIIIETECILADVYTTAFNYCSIFSNIIVHYILNDKEVEVNELFNQLNLGYDYIQNIIEIKKDLKIEEIKNINLNILNQC